jgi:hypothetical protein
MLTDFLIVFQKRKLSLLLGGVIAVLLFTGNTAQATSTAPETASISFGQSPIYTAREYDLKLFELPRGVKTGFRFRTESSDLSIPDLGGPTSFINVDAEALANEIRKPKEQDLAFTNTKRLRSSWLNYANEVFRVDLIQSPSRSGIRFLHMATGLRFEAERKLLTGYSSVFIGVRLSEDKRFEPTAGCTYTQQNNDSRSFCGLQVRVGL